MRAAMRVRAVAVLAATVLVGAIGGDQLASAGTSAGAPAPRLADAHPCADIGTFTCAYLTVPLDRGGRTPGTLRLQVAIADNADAPRGVLLVLTGGPGQPGVGLLPRIRQRISYLLDDYRLVMIDQRGTGEGAIDCPRLQAEVGSSDITPPSAAAVQECADLLGEARNFYTTADTVADLEDLRRAVGVRHWTLDGVSYGTFVAARYGLTYPHRVSRMVLDSVVPQPGVPALYEDSLHHSGEVLRRACAEQNCGFDPAADLATTVRAQHNGVGVFDLIVVTSIFDPKFTGQNWFPVLDLLHLAAQGDAGPLEQAIAAIQGGDGTPPADYSAGLHVATICADLAEAPWGDAAAPIAGRDEAVERALEKISPEYVWPFEPTTAVEQGIVHACRHWPPTRPNPDARIHQLPMPVLLIAGDRDLSTPMRWAVELVAQTPRGELVVIPGMGHAIQGRNPEGDNAVNRFLTGA
jgi:pimeloyl-ACP methyl ester carboxylesterase